MRKIREIHLWLGLILSLFLLMEAVTGLVLAEPWLVGASGNHFNAGGGARLGAGGPPSVAGTGNTIRPQRGAGSGIYGVMRSLHSGRIAGVNFKWIIDITAIAMIILTITGVYLAIVTLRARGKVKRR